MTLGDKIASARRERNLTQEAFAGMLDVSRQAVSRWESDLSYPEVDNIVKVCGALELDCDYLLKKEADGSELAEDYRLTSDKNGGRLTAGEKISLARRRVNLTQEQLAGLIGVSRQAVSRWESGTAYPEMDKVIKLCDSLQINCDYLLKENVTESGIKVVEKVIEKVVEKKIVVERLVEKTVFKNVVSKTVVYENFYQPAACAATPVQSESEAEAPRALNLAYLPPVLVGVGSVLLGAAFFLFGVVTLCIAMYWSYGSFLPLMLLWLSVFVGVAFIISGASIIRRKGEKSHDRMTVETIMR